MKKTILFTIVGALALATIAPAHARGPVAGDRLRGLEDRAAALMVGAGDVPVLASSAQTRLEGKLNVNEATAEQWTLLPGIGPSTAAKVVSYQKSHGFKQVAHVMRVKGIGRKTFERIKPYLALEGQTTLHPAK